MSSDTKRQCFRCGEQVEQVDEFHKGRVRRKGQPDMPAIAYRVFECPECGHRTKR